MRIVCNIKKLNTFAVDLWQYKCTLFFKFNTLYINIMYQIRYNNPLSY